MQAQSYLEVLQQRLSQAEKLAAFAEQELDKAEIKLEEAEEALEAAQANVANLKKNARKARVQELEKALQWAGIAFDTAQVAAMMTHNEASVARVRLQAYIDRDETFKPIPEEIAFNWRLQVAQVLTDYTKIQTFPTPPQLVACANKRVCDAEERALSVCKCNIRHAFQEVKNLKKERTMWHPDKFACCPEDKREEFQRMAKEVFVVVDAMYQRQRKGKK